MSEYNDLLIRESHQLANRLRCERIFGKMRRVSRAFADLGYAANVASSQMSGFAYVLKNTTPISYPR